MELTSSQSNSNPNNVCRIDAVFENWAAKKLSEMKTIIPTIKTVYQWNILKNGKPASVWTCDFKNGDGAIHRGPPKTGKPDCALTIEDDSVCRIFEGKEDAMRAFMSGKLKISGNILAAQKLQQLWAEESTNVQSNVSSEKSENQSAGSEYETDPDVEKIPTSGNKCDLIFNVFMNRAQEEPEYMRKLRVIFQFNVLKNGKPACIWTADNKSSPDVVCYREPPRNVKPDCIVTMEDDDLLKVMVGKVNPQRLFMMGKIKIKGNIMLMQRLNSLWLEFQKLGKTPELPLAVDILVDHPLKPGLRSEYLIIDLVQRIVRIPGLHNQASGSHQFNITKDGKVVSQWVIDLKTDAPKVRRGTDPEAVTVTTVDDYNFAKWVMMKLTLADGLATGKIKVTGDKTKLEKLNKLFTTPTSLGPKL
ncbi:uncharacterized protein LOC107368336 [Tetranychus urticae]|uniref:SCP2 domain-containing protein n=1 Tax=Tetranychus urticae TaxID=32264 RepID=T1KXM8_TETUR|nr:uncharacterized protein LOC107368336 [Tetranychus urticae]